MDTFLSCAYVSQLFTNKGFYMKTRLWNYFIDTNALALNKAVLECPQSVLPRTWRITTLKRPVHFYQPFKLYTIKFFETSHHFDKVKPTKFFTNFILNSENRQEDTFYGYLVRNNVPIKFLKIYVSWQHFYEKQKMFKPWMSY